MKLKPIAILFSATYGISLMAHAELKPVELRIGDSLPPGHIIAENSTLPWMDEVKRLSDGKITFKYFPAEQVGKAKDMLSLTQSGVLDIGYVGPAYVSDKMPLSAVAELPGSFSKACQVMRAYWSLAKEGGYLYENEFKQNKIRPLFIAALPPYQMVVGTDKKIDKLDDFKGLKLRASGGAQDLTLRNIDVVPIKMAPPEIYESMSRGTIDGTLLSFVSVESYKLSPLVKSATLGSNFGTVVVTYSISDAKWNSLPKEAQDILLAAGDEVTNNACSRFDQQELETTERLRAAGVHFVELSGDDKAYLDNASNDVAQRWAAELDSRKRPGTDTLKAFREALARVQ